MHRMQRSFRSPRSRGANRRIDVSRFINKAVAAEETEHFKPVHSFADFNVGQTLKNNIAAKGYKVPTPIQDKAIPHILQGADVVGIANTGTGKTAAFLIPLINKIVLNQKQMVIIVVPTRELGIQIDHELQGFTKQMGIFSVCAIGGASVGRQIADLRRRHNFIIGTPGRIKDFIKRGFIDLSKFNTIVLDEADRMLDMGFINDVKFMIDRMPKERQTLFFSATLSREIEGLIKNFLRNPVMISVKIRNTPKNIDQDIVKIQNGELKVDVLEKLLANKLDFSKVLVFGRTKHGVERLSRMLAGKGFRVESIHSNKTHSHRQKALSLFKDSRIQVLVATDVAARGIDIADVSHVINYDIPATYEDYIHRIGRTGRGDKSGKALTFIPTLSLE